MAEMAANAERMARVPAFYRIIERHVQFSISCKFRIDDLRRARKRIAIPKPNLASASLVKIDWSAWSLPHFVGFRTLLDSFHSKREIIEKVLPLEQPVDFIFDEQTEKAPLLAGWQEYLDSRPPHVRARFGSPPIFRDDRVFLPIQAADLWAWWVRRWYDDGTPHLIAEPDFGAWKAHRESHPKLVIEFDEDALTQNLLTSARDCLPTDHWVWDLGLETGFRGWRGNGREWQAAVAAFDRKKARD